MSSRRPLSDSSVDDLLDVAELEYIEESDLSDKSDLSEDDNFWYYRHFSECPSTPIHTNASSIEAYEQSEVKNEYPPFIDDPYGSVLGELSLERLLSYSDTFE